MRVFIAFCILMCGNGNLVSVGAAIALLLWKIIDVLETNGRRRRS